MNRSHRRRAAPALLAALAASWLFLGGGRLEASAELRKHLGEFARDIKKFLDQRGEKAVAMGQFAGPPQLAANPGPGLALILSQELQKLQVVVKLKANLGITGEFRDVTDVADPDNKQLAVELKVKIVDRKNQALQVFSCGIFGAPDVAYLVGAVTRLPVNADARGRAAQLEKDLENSPAHVRGARVSAGADRPYAVEILVNQRPRKAQLVDGLPFVEVNRGEIYSIRLANDSDHDAAVLLSIDGINVFAFNEDPEPDGVQREYRVIVPKRGTSLVQGWYRKAGRSDSFLVTGYADSAAAFLSAGSNKIGTVTASFHAAWEKGKAPPADEGQALSSNATGFGPPVEERYVRLEREIGVVRDVVTVRYSRD
jgi:hypothetical protein